MPATAPTIASVVARHRRGWIADAGAFLRVLDWEYLAGKQLAIVDFDDVPGPPQHGVAFTTPVGLFELLRPYLADSRLEPGPAMMIGTAKIADLALTTDFVHRHGEAATARAMRSVVNSVAMHEYAHAIDFVARGVALPAATTLESVLAANPTPSQARRSHSPEWLRAFAHLVYRSTAVPCHRDACLDRFREDAAAQGYGTGDDYLDALHADFLAHGLDCPLVNVLRTPAPAGFNQLVEQRGAARSAQGENYAGIT